ncbi:MAG TPA: glycosyltransferase family 4 protein [Syntrophorhabdaceae bacterium]|nr:glycosyltransferase family 4 protein [Syntrophorhabdaceae bacterium]
MDVWVVQIAEPTPLSKNSRQMRTGILAEKLMQRGHDVLWWISAFDHLRKEWLFRDDTEVTLKHKLRIKAIKGSGYKKNVSMRRYLDHKLIANKFKRQSGKMPKPDVVIASLPPHDVAYEAAVYARNNHVPIILDVRDTWPDIFLDNVSPGLTKLANAVLRSDFEKTREAMKIASGIVAVSNTFLKWALKYANRDRTVTDKVFYLGAGRSDCILRDASEEYRILLSTLTDKFVVTFVGTFSSYHNPSIIIKCARTMKQKDIVFVLAGDGDNSTQIRKGIRELDNVILPGWLDKNQIDLLLSKSHVGLCPTSKDVDLFPNKAFSYLSAGLPIVSAFNGDLKDLLAEYEIGFTYHPGDSEGLARYITILYENSDLYRRMSANAKQVFKEIFDADKIYEEYALHIEGVQNAYSTGKLDHRCKR